MAYYIQTWGEYSQYGIGHLIESDLPPAEVVRLLKEYANRQDTQYLGRKKEIADWVLSHPVLKDGTLVNLTRKPELDFTEGSNWRLWERACTEFEAEHPEEHLSDAWLAAQGVRVLSFKEIHEYEVQE